MIDEIRIGPKQSQRDVEIALDEIQAKLNEIIRVVNDLLVVLELDENESSVPGA